MTLARELSAREVIDAHLTRIDDVNPQLNAVTVVLADDARTAADAADAALDEPRASCIATPRCCTVGMKSDFSQSRPTRSIADCPLTRAWNTSGYWVAEWFPQIITFCTSSVDTPSFIAS